MADKLVINDVGPRDGLQNQPRRLSTSQRIALIKALVEAGLPAVEIGGFVSPKAVPAMAGSDEVATHLPLSDCHYSAFVPNLKGYESARAVGIKAVNLAIAASNTMNERNIRMTTDEATRVCEQVIEQGREDGIEVVPYIATAWACAYEGEVDEAVVMQLSETFLVAGAPRVYLADTIGAANPAQVRRLVSNAVAKFGADNIACHFHDTRGFGVANTFAAVEEGVRRFDASIAGLGGCPFAPGASGNVATEDVVVLLEQMGFDTGIDQAALVAAAEMAIEMTEGSTGGRALPWLAKQLKVKN